MAQWHAASWGGWLACWCILLALPLAARAEQQEQQPLICVILRTYWGHGAYGQHELWRLMHSLQSQTYTK